MKIFSGSSNKLLSQRVSKALNLPLSKFEIFIFPDGEKRVKVQDRVVDLHCIIIQPTAPPVDQNYMELFFMIDSLKRSGASRVTAVVPYLGYQRQDHVFRDGEAVSLEVIRSVLEVTGLDRIITFDLHTIKTPDLFKIEFVHLSALKLFAKTIKEDKLFTKDTVLISPDMGGIRRIKILSSYLSDMPYATIYKNRNLLTGEVNAVDIEGLPNKHSYTKAIIVDDMISSGGTIISASNLLHKYNISQVCVFATHPVFSEKVPQLLQESNIKRVYITDGIEIPPNQQFPKLKIISISQIIANNLLNNAQ